MTSRYHRPSHFLFLSGGTDGIPRLHVVQFVTMKLRVLSVVALVLAGLFAVSMSSVSAAVNRAPQPQVRVSVLVYHHIRDTKPYPKTTWSWKMSVTPAVFEKQMQWIHDNGYTTIDLDTAAAILQGQRSDISKPLVITFDDNQRTQYTLAFPVLKKLKQTGVFYLVTNRLKNPSFIMESEVKEMSDAGMSIQSHTITHATMTALGLKKLDAELKESRAALEAITGKPVLHLAYPSTAHNKTVRERAKAAGYVTAGIMDPRYATSKDDLFRLPRIMMTDDTNLAKLLP
jgi:peptidoglycan/xylan/chitin deacetylase (PgdA/CDA1 family)